MENEIKKIMTDILGVEINDDSDKQNVDEWDSFNHLEILVCLEKKYDIEFSPEEMGSLNSYKDILKIVIEKKQI